MPPLTNPLTSPGPIGSRQSGHCPGARCVTRPVGSSPRAPSRSGRRCGHHPSRSSTSTSPPRRPSGIRDIVGPPARPGCTSTRSARRSSPRCATPRRRRASRPYAAWPPAALADVLAAAPRLLVLLTNVRDPGNAGTVIRGADAAGADAVLVSDALRRRLRAQGRAFHRRIAVPPAGRDRAGGRGDARRSARRTASGSSPPTARARALLPDVDLAVPARLGDGQRGVGAGADEVRDACDEVVRVPDLRPGRVAQPRDGRHGLPLRVGGPAAQRR